MIRSIRIWLAAYRLQRLIDQRRLSYEVRRYREKRSAALLGIARRKGVAA